MKLIKLLKYDFCCGLTKIYKHLIAWFVLCMFFCIILPLKTIHAHSVEISLLDYFLFLFAGEYPYDPSIGVAFQIPYQWLILNAFILYTLCSYPIDDMKGFGQKILIKSQNRCLWWTSKYIWTQLMSVFMYVILFFSVCIVGIFFKMDGLFITATSWMINDLVGLAGLPPFFQLLQVICMPLIVINFLLSFQNLVSLLTNHILSFIVSISILFISAYINQPIFVGNISMFRRISIDMISNFSIVLKMTVLTICNILLFALGAYKFRSMDIFFKNSIVGESDND